MTSGATPAPAPSPGEPDGDAAVVVEDLVLRYGETTAVDGVSFAAHAGAVTTILGPNGAGKTSTVEHLEGYRPRAGGRARVLGHDPSRDHRALTRRVGVMLQDGGIPTAIRPGELLRQYAGFFDRPLDPHALLRRVGLAHREGTPFRRLSGGEQRRLSLALAIIGRPDVVFLDEPTAGIDLDGRDAVRDVVARLRDDGVCVVMTTHDLDEAEKLAGSDADYYRRDLFEAIERGDFPKWKLFVQVMPEADAETVPYHPFDLTKVWPKADYPLIEVGEWELNRNAENYHAEVEQVAFNPANVVPGIGFSPDRMLQGRLFSYGDAQRYRLGVNHHQIPVNQPKGCPMANPYHRDGAMRLDSEPTPGIEPNSYGRWQEQPQFREPPLRIDPLADRFDFREDDDDYFGQPGALFRTFTPAQQQRLFENTARAITGASAETIQRHIDNCTQADPAYGAGVRAAVDALGAGAAPIATDEDLTAPPGSDVDLL